MNLPSIWGWSIEVKRTVWWTWVQKAGRLDRSLDHGRNPPLFGLLPSSEDRPPAPLPATNYRDTMCVTAWSDSPNEASIGMLSRGGGGCYIGLVVGPWPKRSFFWPLATVRRPPPSTISRNTLSRRDVCLVLSDSPNDASIGTLSRGVVDTFYILPGRQDKRQYISIIRH